jgi:hypothetical protein
MANPNSRETLKDYCMRSLGFPVIDINVDEDQLEDRIDEALQKFYSFHFDGTLDTYLAHKITEADVQNKYILVPDLVVGVTRILSISSSVVNSTSAANFNMFDLNYQLRLNEFYDFTSSSYTYYVMARQHIELINLLLIGEKPIRFNKTTNRVYLDLRWGSAVNVDDYVVLQCQAITNPTEYIKVYNDNWLKEYTTCLFKRQWGLNVSKYSNYSLPGGIQINGERILAEAEAEKLRLEGVLRDTYEEPPMFLVG